jgi:hypothetical protein
LYIEEVKFLWNVIFKGEIQWQNLM